jgi:hypothetical protein
MLMESRRLGEDEGLDAAAIERAVPTLTTVSIMSVIRGLPVEKTRKAAVSFQADAC